jgi:hypothetical protein
MIMLHGKKLRVIVLSIKYCYPLLRIGKTLFFYLDKIARCHSYELKKTSFVFFFGD